MPPAVLFEHSDEFFAFPLQDPLLIVYKCTQDRSHKQQPHVDRVGSNTGARQPGHEMRRRDDVTINETEGSPGHLTSQPATATVIALADTQCQDI